MVQTAPPDTGRIPAVDGLRGIAILSVMIFHFRSFGGSLGTALWEKLYANLADLGTVGVDLFFVISGFLITGILFDSRSRPSYYSTFFVRRTLRIFPIYYASLILFLLFAPPAFASNWQIFAWLYGLNWPIGLFGFSFAPPLLQHFWTLSVEEQFYLAWPKIVRTLDRKRLIFACAMLI